MVRLVSISKQRQAKKDLVYWTSLLADARRIGLTACAADRGGDRFGPRADAIRNYCGVRRWITHYRNWLADIHAVKFSNGRTLT